MKRASTSLCLILLIGILNGKTLEGKAMEKLGDHIVTQIGIVVHDVEKSAQAWSQLLGMDKPNIVVTDPIDKSNTHYNGMPTEAQAKLAFFI